MARAAGIQSVLRFKVAYLVYGHQPQVGASADALADFYDGDRMRILVAACFYGLAVLSPMWFQGALRTPRADAGQDSWRGAATASSAAPRGAFPLAHRGVAALAYSTAGAGNHMLTIGPERLRVGFVPARDSYQGRGILNMDFTKSIEHHP